MTNPKCDVCGKPLIWTGHEYGIKLTRCRVHVKCIREGAKKFYPDVWKKSQNKNSKK